MEEKEILKRITAICPTEEEVNEMSEYDWMGLVYPIKCFKAGMKYQKELDTKEDKSESEVKE